eukprot:CAMPEP_0179287854 /NCGR_PEP_ID=MMETSP0797-20121207/40482_1 /TAXON_ID=47934 /ORGANISM="Dinophysis acuminata, Strain DAEP01" /LENGTH=85 /DNA_ID=CAMNT_0020996803 /DNA_START=10 /DNA_END=264 /DNA_ORIENTATION=+
MHTPPPGVAVPTSPTSRDARRDEEGGRDEAPRRDEGGGGQPTPRRAGPFTKPRHAAVGPPAAPALAVALARVRLAERHPLDAVHL